MPVRREDLDEAKEEIVGLYHSSGLPMTKIAERFDVHPTTIRDRFIEWGIKRRQPSEYNRIDLSQHREEIIQLYLEQKLSTTEICKRYCVSDATIASRLKEWGIDLRGNVSQVNGQSINEYDEGSIIRAYNRGESATKIARDLGVYAEAVRRILRKNDNYDNPYSCIEFSDKEKEEIIRLYTKDRVSSQGVADVFDVSKNTILRNLKAWGIERDIGRAKYIEKSTFSAITPSCAYWVGYIAGDGSISDKNDFSVSSKDKEHIQKLKNFLGSDHKIGKVEINGSYYYRLGFRSRDICEDLRAIGIIANKSLTLEISQEYERLLVSPNFIRGIVDSDGCIYRHPNNGNVTLSIFTGSKLFKEQIVSGLKNILVEYIPKVYERGNGRGWSIRITDSSKTIEMLKILYDCPPAVALDRKFNLAKQMIREYS